MKSYKIRALDEYIDIIGPENLIEISEAALRERVRRRLKKNISIKKIFLELIKPKIFEINKTFKKLEKYDEMFNSFVYLMDSMTLTQKKCCKRYLNNFLKNK